MLSLQVSLNIEIVLDKFPIKLYMENLIPTNNENQEVFSQKIIVQRHNKTICEYSKPLKIRNMEISWKALNI